MLTDEEVNEIISYVHAMELNEMIREIYRKGYDQAVEDINRLEENGVFII